MTTDAEYVRALAALDLGVASAQPTKAPGFKFPQVLQPAVLPRTHAQPTPEGLIRSTLTVAGMVSAFLWPVILLSTACWIAADILGADVIALLCSASALFFASVIVHEAGHVLAYRTMRPDHPAVFSARLGRFRLVRLPLTVSQDITVTVAGPSATLTIPLLLLPGYPLWPLQFWAAIIIALAHISLLVRSDGDGAMLRAALQLRSRRTKTAKRT